MTFISFESQEYRNDEKSIQHQIPYFVLLKYKIRNLQYNQLLKEQILTFSPLVRHKWQVGLKLLSRCCSMAVIIFMSQYFRKYIKKQHYPTPPQNIKFKTTFRNCVYRGLTNREWRETDGDDWNVMWCEKEQIDWVFEKYRLQPGSKVNHFRGWNQLCRKDMLSKNLKRFKRALEKQGNSAESNEYDFLPPTFLMPSEYVIFYEQFKRQNNEKMLWIMKPTSKCQGKGIFIFNKISDISKWKGSNKDISAENYVCQRYILNPLLFGGRKFDMRIYALCTSYNPLTVYLYRNGFARFAHDHYDNTDTQNLYKHLTNVAINMYAPTYVKRIGGKWFLDNLKNFMLSKFGLEKTNQSFSDIQRAIIKSLKAVQKLVTNSPHSFQLYGYDFLFDTDGKAWLLQVNGGPSMTANTPEDSALKVGVIDDVMTIINVEGVLKGDEQVIGGFDLIYKNKQITLPEASIYTSMLGCRVNRMENMRKLARSCAYRLSKQFLQAETNKLKQEAKKKQQVVNKFNLKITKPRSNNMFNQIPTNPNLKKKNESGNNDFNRYISERQERKSTTNTNTPHQIKNQQEQQQQE